MSENKAGRLVAAVMASVLITSCGIKDLTVQNIGKAANDARKYFVDRHISGEDLQNFESKAAKDINEEGNRLDDTISSELVAAKNSIGERANVARRYFFLRGVDNMKNGDKETTDQVAENSESIKVLADRDQLLEELIKSLSVAQKADKDALMVAIAAVSKMSGPQGPQGPAGSSGSNGSNGSDGSDGAQGEAGPAGSDGQDGENGENGAAGAPGAAGPQGPQGPSGAPCSVSIVYVPHSPHSNPMCESDNKITITCPSSSVIYCSDN